MVARVVETFRSGEVWRNRIVGRDPLPGEYQTQEAAIEVARVEARLRGIEHVVLRPDGTVAQRNRYPRRSDELPA